MFFSVTGACSHGRVKDLYIESIHHAPHTDVFMSKSCDSWDDYMNEVCHEHVQPIEMGEGLNPDQWVPFYNPSVTSVGIKSSPKFPQSWLNCSHDSLYWLAVVLFKVAQIVVKIMWLFILRNLLLRTLKIAKSGHTVTVYSPSVKESSVVEAGQNVILRPGLFGLEAFIRILLC